MPTTFAFLCLAQTAQLSAEPTGSSIASTSNVVWTDAHWSSDGTGAMPIGNGDIASSVWIDDDSGDMRILLSKSDVFDENSQPVKTGVLRFAFDPPLWAGGAGPTPTPPKPHCSGDLSDYTSHGDASHSIICDQKARFKIPSFKACSSGGAACAASAAKACCADAKCVAFSLNPGWSGGLLPEFCSSTATPDKPGPGWMTWTQNGVAPPTPTPGPTPALATCPPGAAFCQTLDLPTATVTIVTPTINVEVFIDLNAPHRDGVAHRDAGILHVVATSTSDDSETTAMSSTPFGLTVTLEPYRVEGKKTTLGRGFCFPRFEHADEIVATQDDTLVWYHWNHINATYYNDTIRNQGLHPAKYAATLIDPFAHLAFGGKISASNGALKKKSSLSLSGNALTKIDVAVTLLTMKVDDTKKWISEIGKVTPAPPAPPLRATSTRRVGDVPDVVTTWDAIWNRSFIEVTAVTPNASSSALAKEITDHLNWDRYLALIQGRVAFAPIKFNGQAFNCNNTGKGWDARDWGADYWWQNERQPYYNTIAQGDFDTMRAFLDFYLRMLPYNEERTKVQFLGTDTVITAGAFYEETCTQFGMYNEGDWGCNHPIPAPNGASSNTFIRFHWTGGLELSLMLLDYYDATGDEDDLKRYLPMAIAVVEAFRQRFPNKNATTGKIDMFPAQALETYQCPDPTKRDGCPTNPSTDIGGLMSVLPRLIALPTSLPFVTAAQRSKWAAHLAALPALPLDVANSAKGSFATQKLAPIQNGAWKNQGRHNSENTELYVAHPFRLYGVGKPGLALAQQTYSERHSPCNDGWCQDIIQAAMLNLTNDAANYLAQRATAATAKGFRFKGFAPHNQDYECVLSFVILFFHRLFIDGLKKGEGGGK